MSARKAMVIVAAMAASFSMGRAVQAAPYFKHQAVGCLTPGKLDTFETAVAEGDTEAAIARLDAGCYLLLRQDFEVQERLSDYSKVRVYFEGTGGALELLVPNRYMDRE